jgi:glycine cleavage system H protein
MLRFSKDHEWLRVEDGIATVGITQYAQEKLGDLVYVELPHLGAKLAMGAVAATVESVKAASEVYAPISGEVFAVNDKLSGDPGLVNSDPIGNGWLFKLKIADSAELSQLLDEATYKAMTI